MACAPSKDSDQSGHPPCLISLRSAWWKLGPLATHWAHSEDSDQTGWMPRLIWVFAGHTSHHDKRDLSIVLSDPLTMHSHPLKKARDAALCLKLPLVPYNMYANNKGSGKTVWMGRLTWALAVRLCDKYQFHLDWLICEICPFVEPICEPHHQKTCLRGFWPGKARNWSAQLQRLARVLKLWI